MILLGDYDASECENAERWYNYDRESQRVGIALEWSELPFKLKVQYLEEARTNRIKRAEALNAEIRIVVELAKNPHTTIKELKEAIAGMEVAHFKLDQRS